MLVYTALTLTCTTTLDPNVDNSQSVRIEFNGLNHLSDNVLSLGPVTLLSMGEYTRNVTISPVTVKDSGGYTCTVTVSGSSTATSSKDNSISVTSEGNHTHCTFSVSVSIGSSCTRYEYIFI